MGKVIFYSMWMESALDHHASDVDLLTSKLGSQFDPMADVTKNNQAVIKAFAMTDAEAELYLEAHEYYLTRLEPETFRTRAISAKCPEYCKVNIPKVWAVEAVANDDFADADRYDAALRSKIELVRTHEKRMWREATHALAVMAVLDQRAGLKVRP